MHICIVIGGGGRAVVRVNTGSDTPSCFRPCNLHGLNPTVPDTLRYDLERM